MVHGIVKSMGGGLFIETEVGIGTTVRVIFPVLIENQAFERAAESAQPGARGAGNVLIVDDEEAITKLTTLMLEGRGFTVESFNDAGIALKALEASPKAYDVALVDYTMPGRTGLELAREFRSLNAEMPVIVTTGLMDMSELEKSKSLNIVQIIKKPFDADDLVAAINRSL